MRKEMFKFTCPEDDMTMTANTEDELVNKLLEHMKVEHQDNLPRSEAKKWVREANKHVGAAASK